MTYLTSWEEFEGAAEKLYQSEPRKTRYSMKYDHAHGILNLKVTDDTVCLQFRTEYIQDLKKVEKFVCNMMRQMASKEH